MVELKVAVSELGSTISGCGSRLQQRADAARQALAGNQFLIVAERDEPSLAAEHAHFADMIHVDQRVAMNAPEAACDETLFDSFQRERGHVTFARCEDPDDFSFGLERQNLIH